MKNIISNDIFASPENIAKRFFLLQDDEKHLLQDQEVLKEILRRVTVFYTELMRSNELYAVLANAYNMNPIDEKAQAEYMAANARGFVNFVLFGNEDKKYFSQEDIIGITEKLEVLFGGSTDNRAQQIVIRLQEMLQKISLEANPEELEEASSSIRHVSNFLADFQTSDLDFDEVHRYPAFHKVGLIKKHFLKESFQDYNDYISEYSFYKNELKDLDQEEFATVLKQAEEVLQSLGKVESDENQLQHYISKLLTEDTPTSEANFDFLNLVEDHLKKYSIYHRQRTFARKVSEHEEWYWEATQVVEKGNILWLSAYGQFFYEIGGKRVVCENFKHVLAEYSKYIGLKNFDKQVGQADYEQIEKDKIHMGAKAAYLYELQRFLQKVETYRESIMDVQEESEEDEGNDHVLLLPRDTYYIPQFEEIDIRHYHSRKETWKLDDTYFQPLFEKRTQKDVKYIVRSSAVNSEDNEHSTGAGIYDSIPVEQASSYEVFCVAIKKIYESCDSPRAIKYRADNNITSESMGIIIQEYQEKGENGHINSIMPHRPELSEITFSESLLRPIIRNDKIENTLFNCLVRHDEFMHYVLDSIKHHKGDSANLVIISKYIAQLTYLLARYFNKIMQMEFVAEWNDFWGRDIKIHIVQARPLPDELREVYDITFPEDKEPLWESKAIGVCDEEYDVLTTGEDNGDKEGVVVFSSAQYASLHESFVERSIPKKGVVIVKSASAYQGHIETLCAEKGIVCIFPESEPRGWGMLGSSIDLMNSSFLGISPTQAVKRVYSDFEGHTRVKIIADGLIGKIYAV